MKKRKNKNRRVGKQSADVTHIEMREIFKLASVALVVIVGIYFVRGIEDVPIKTVMIDSTLHKVSKQDIRKVAANYVREGFFTINLSKFEHDLELIPWVYKASIKRKWPSKLLIEIEEQTPRFRWTGQSLLNKQASPFLVGDFDAYKNLPKLSGLAGREKYLAQLYRQYNERFRKLGLSIKSVEEDARYDKVITLMNGISISVGREKTSQQMERCLRSFVEFSDDERAAIASIDLRHSNGFAVRWNS